MVSLNNFIWLKRTTWIEKVADAAAFGWDLENMHWLVCVPPALGPAFNAHALHTRQGSFAELVLMQLFPTVHFCHNLCYLQQCLLLSETLCYKPIKWIHSMGTRTAGISLPAESLLLAGHKSAWFILKGCLWWPDRPSKRHHQVAFEDQSTGGTASLCNVTYSSIRTGWWITSL